MRQKREDAVVLGGSPLNTYLYCYLDPLLKYLIVLMREISVKRPVVVNQDSMLKAFSLETPVL